MIVYDGHTCNHRFGEDHILAHAFHEQFSSTHVPNFLKLNAKVQVVEVEIVISFYYLQYIDILC